MNERKKESKSMFEWYSFTCITIGKDQMKGKEGKKREKPFKAPG
jgi:hypothetical protein